MHEPLSEEIEISRKILEANEQSAQRNRELFAKNGLFAVNLMGSPGAGKTSLLEKTIPELGDLRIAVIEGDIEGEQDKERVAGAGACSAVQINTYGACHLLAHQAEHALEELNPGSVDLLFVENVGNLVCPAEFDLGESARVMVLGVTEGGDKPLKYPLMFRKSEVLLLNKMDIAQFSGCDIEALKANVKKVNPQIEIIEISCRTGEGLERWTDWLRRKVEATRKKEQ
jgi:hydrogenase nickel incorporation protein HypB